MLKVVNLHHNRKATLNVTIHPDAEANLELKVLLSPYVGKVDPVLGVSLYKSYLEKAVKDPAFKAVLERYKDKDIVVGCSCPPWPCHIDVINFWLQTGLVEPVEVDKQIEIPNDEPPSDYSI